MYRSLTIQTKIPKGCMLVYGGDLPEADLDGVWVHFCGGARRQGPWDTTRSNGAQRFSYQGPERIGCWSSSAANPPIASRVVASNVRATLGDKGLPCWT
jgi:hypothetical protein